MEYLTTCIAPLLPYRMAINTFLVALSFGIAGVLVRERVIALRAGINPFTGEFRQ